VNYVDVIGLQKPIAWKFILGIWPRFRDSVCQPPSEHLPWV